MRCMDMNRKKIITLCLSIILLALIGVGGTLAYLTSNTEQLNNRFTSVSYTHLAQPSSSASSWA